ncbi:Tetratricopeptide TPR_2 repeat protein [Candidatus Magnetobacterium bavaricum]|uniref:Tetratricopeptide TPR_2 repeat protein n=1 Tax=Candidatus Magnetobacterium bavaricum TaxID=29290 RepID=A0A0F3GQP5_9BACT|nr:Tetratricopeptide TPR_2 repeat protein [Candidatus Magnetobacterium bavaricum]
MNVTKYPSCSYNSGVGINSYNITRPSFILGIVILLTLVSYWPLQYNDFINFDDDRYLTENPIIQSGLTVNNALWSFRTLYFGNWHPLTWLSYLGDVSVFGLRPDAIHLVNLLLHLCNTALLFAFLNATTKLPWQSALVAALFALHPLNVESVAWAAERKSVLSTFFWMLTMLCYSHYATHPTAWRYMSVVLCLALGLMAKPMLVTLPFVLLLLDYWPLKRGLHVVEKLPLLLLSLLCSTMTILAQQKAEALVPLTMSPMKGRIFGAITSYTGYIQKLMVPTNLAVIYPPSTGYPLWHVGLALATIATLTTVFVIRRTTHPHLLIGWLWYLGSLVPVLQIVQVGSAPMADRYVYIPAVGLFIIVAYTPAVRLWRGVLVATVVIVFSILTFRQVLSWRNSETVFRHALHVTDNNYVAHDNYGVYLLKSGRAVEAVEHFSAGLRYKPDSLIINSNMWSALVVLGRYDEAEQYFYRAMPMWKKLADRKIYGMLTVFLSQKKKDDVAFLRFIKAIQQTPDDVQLCLQWASRTMGDNR